MVNLIKLLFIAYNRQGNRYWKVTCPYLPAHYPGTGDTFTSVITGSLMQGDSLPMALDRATQFILQGIRATFGYEYDNREVFCWKKYSIIWICRYKWPVMN